MHWSHVLTVLICGALGWAITVRMDELDEHDR